MSESGGWFAGLGPEDMKAACRAIQDGQAATPRDWPEIAVEHTSVESDEAYYAWLQTAALEATRRTVREREQADDQQLIHAVRALDDCTRTANELAERLAEWHGTVAPDAGTGIPLARELASRQPAATDHHSHRLARRIVGLADDADTLRRSVEAATPQIAPNLSALAGPVLAARLISLAGGLEALAKKPSGTVQVLGAEDALFAHLQGDAPSPKHGVIYTHEAVSGTRPADRGSAARALAGKLAIAARVDHYGGDRRPELEHELADRIAAIRARAGETSG